MKVGCQSDRRILPGVCPPPGGGQDITCYSPGVPRSHHMTRQLLHISCLSSPPAPDKTEHWALSQYNWDLDWTGHLTWHFYETSLAGQIRSSLHNGPVRRSTILQLIKLFFNLRPTLKRRTVLTGELRSRYLSTTAHVDCRAEVQISLHHCSCWL